jgi:uroporphyrinogen-III decarboxylase
MFPSLVRSPFCISAHLVGLQNMLMYMLTEEEFVRKAMRFSTDFIKQWETERIKFTGQPLQTHKLFNDEIDCPTISPEMYRDLILPYEKELAEFFGGVSYWHSCGSITRILPYIHEIPDIEMFHVGPWTDLETVCRIFPQGTTLDICLKPEDDVYYASAKQMVEKLRFIRKTSEGFVPGVRADVFQKLEDWQENLKKINLWIDTARTELG